MNFQRTTPEYVIKLLKEQKPKLLSDDLSYYAFPMTFGSTCGPRPGIGGSAMTVFTVESWVESVEGWVVYVCAGMYSVSRRTFSMNPKIGSWQKIPEGEDKKMPCAGCGKVVVVPLCEECKVMGDNSNFM